jgi:hypothetical protein
MPRLLPCLLLAASLASPALAGERDGLITNDLFPRSPDFISRDLVPPPIDLATTQVRPGQALTLPRSPRPVPDSEVAFALWGAELGAGGCFEVEGEECYVILGETDIQVWIDTPGIGRYEGFGLYD